MSEQAQTQRIYDLIVGALSQQTEQIKQSEQQLQIIAQEQPDDLILAYISLLRSSQEKAIRQFSAIGIRKYLSVYTQKSYINIWDKLTLGTQNIVKTELFIYLQNEPERQVRSLICDAISELASSLLLMETHKGDNVLGHQGNQWPEFIEILFGFCQTQTISAIDSTLKILANCLRHIWQAFLPFSTQLYNLMLNGLNYDHLDVKLSAILAISAWLSQLDTKYSKHFEDLLPCTLQAIILLIQQNEFLGTEALTALSDIAESEPKFLKKNFKLLFKTMQEITQSILIEDEGIKQLTIEILVLTTERIPSLLRTNQDLLKELLEMILMRMLDIDDEITDDWSKPPEGYSQDLDNESDFANIRFGMSTIDRLIGSIGYQIFLPILLQMVQQMLEKSPSWKYKNAGIMALSQVGEYVENIEYISPIIQIVTHYLLDPHPKLRYAACHCIGQIADDTQPYFQQKLMSSCVPQLIELMNDEIPRVSSHACAALTNIFEGSPQEYVLPYMNKVLEQAFNLIWNNNSISIIKENAMSCISSVAESCREQYIPYYQISMSILFNILETHTQLVYKQLRGQTIECITLISYAVGLDLFREYANKLIQNMIYIQVECIQDDIPDPLICYLFTGWQRICLLMEKHIIPYMQHIVPSLFNMTHSIFYNINHNLININLTDEAEAAVNMLNVFIDELGSDYSEYIQHTYNLLIPIINYTNSTTIRKTVAKCLPKLLKCLRESTKNTTNDILVVDFTKKCIQILCNTITIEYEPSVIIYQLESLKSIMLVVSDIYIMTSEQLLQQYGNFTLNILRESQNRIHQNQQNILQEDIEQEELRIIDKDNEYEEQLHESINEVYNVILITYKQLALPLINFVQTHILNPTLFQQQQQQHNNIIILKFLLKLISNILQQIGAECIWTQQLQDTIYTYSIYHEADIRQYSIYILGILCEYHPNIFQPLTQHTLQIIQNILNIPYNNTNNNESKVQYMISRDTVVGLLGKIIKYQSTSINLKDTITLWINQLPLQYNRPEAIIQHNLLVDLCLETPELVLGVNGQNLQNVLNVLCTILDTKLSNQIINDKILQILNSLVSSQQTQALLQSVIPILK